MEHLVQFVQSQLSDLANPEDAVHMAAYMKTEMPFYGVRKPILNDIMKQAIKKFPVISQEDYENAIMSLWNLTHREEKHAAIAIAKGVPEYIIPNSIPIYEKLIREGAWWDYIDDISQNLVGKVLLENRDEVEKIMDKWVHDKDMWIRRSAILSQNRHKENTDYERMFSYCLARANESEFFIRKAIGWALREHSKTSPNLVLEFLRNHSHELSSLSVREGFKHLKKQGFEL